MAALIGVSRALFGRKKQGVVARTAQTVKDTVTDDARGAKMADEIGEARA